MVTTDRVFEGIKGIFIALFFLGFVVGASFTIDAVLVFAALLLLYFILQVLQDRNNIAILIGIGLGVLLAALRPAVLPSTLTDVQGWLLVGLILQIVTRVVMVERVEKGK